VDLVLELQEPAHDLGVGEHGLMLYFSR
jgi:hypothetical protein